MTAPPTQLLYIPPGPIAKAFLESQAFVRGIMGPLGSGKSTACVIELLRRANMQLPSPDGVRRTRFAIVRNTYPELKTTTLKTWAQWCPISYGKLNMDSPITHHVKTLPHQLPDGTYIPGIDMEVLFLALDQEKDVKKLLSLEITAAWLNESREIPKAIVDALTGRVGRYPAKNMVLGPNGEELGATWSGILMDTNPPDDQCWWYHLAEVEHPEGWEFYKQPGGLTSEAENLTHLPDQYYTRMVAGKDPDWVKVYVNAEYGFVTEGKAVFPMFRDRIHTSDKFLEPIQGVPLLIGADFGLTPSAVIAQKTADGRWRILDEYVTDNTGVIRFAENLAGYVAQNYPTFKVDHGWGDPNGAKRGENDEKTAIELMNTYTGWKWKAAPGDNTVTMRLEVVINSLNRLVDGNPGLLISPRCQVLRKGFAGGYHYRFIATSNGTRTEDKPRKNAYSHPHDALQYLLLGGGEHDVVLNKVRKRGQVRSRIAKGSDYRMFD